MYVSLKLNCSINRGVNYSFSSSLSWGNCLRATKNFYNKTTKKIVEIFSLPNIQKILGLGLGVGCYYLSGYLKARIPSVLQIKTFAPGQKLSFVLPISLKILLMPIICLSKGIAEEDFFRGNIANTLKKRIGNLCQKYNFSKECSARFARITAVFITTIIYGIVHFLECLLLFRCSPVSLIPELVVALVLGSIFAFSAEITDALYLSLGMNVMCKTLEWFL